MENIFGIFLFVFLSIFLLQWIWKNKILLQFLWQAPGVSLWFLVKNYRYFSRNDSSLYFLSQSVRMYKTSFWAWFGKFFCVVVTDPESFQKFLNSPHCLNRGIVYKFADKFNANGLLTLNMPEWKPHRKILNPSFNTKTIQSFIPIFNEELSICISKLESFSNTNVPINIEKFIADLTFDGIVRTMLGKLWRIQKHDSVVYQKYAHQYFNAIAKRYINPLYYFDSIYHFTNVYKEENEACTYLMNVTKEILQEKNDNWVEDSKRYEQIYSKPDNDVVPTKPQAFIDQIMKIRMIDQKFTEDEMIGELNIVIPAGFDTTSVASSNCILMLAIFKNHQETIYEEIMSIMPKGFDYVQYEDLNKFTFLDRFVKETLRLYPSIPVFARSLTENIKIGKYTYPAGIDILFPIIELHRNKDIWGEDAENFNPDHFLPENIEKIHPYAYLPFCGGLRNCIGMKYAQIFLKIILIRIVSKYKFRTNLKLSDLKFRYGISLELINKHMVYVEKRSG